MTPFHVTTHVQAHGRAQVSAAWWGERFAREERLSGLAHYLAPTKPEDPSDGDAFLAQFAMIHGAEVQDLGGGSE